MSAAGGRQLARAMVVLAKEPCAKPPRGRRGGKERGDRATTNYLRQYDLSLTLPGTGRELNGFAARRLGLNPGMSRAADERRGRRQRGASDAGNQGLEAAKQNG